MPPSLPLPCGGVNAVGEKSVNNPGSGGLVRSAALPNLSMGRGQDAPAPNQFPGCRPGSAAVAPREAARKLLALLQVSRRGLGRGGGARVVGERIAAITAIVGSREPLAASLRRAFALEKRLHPLRPLGGVGGGAQASQERERADDLRQAKEVFFIRRGGGLRRRRRLRRLGGRRARGLGRRCGALLGERSLRSMQRETGHKDKEGTALHLNPSLRPERTPAAGRPRAPASSAAPPSPPRAPSARPAPPGPASARPRSTAPRGRK